MTHPPEQGQTLDEQIAYVHGFIQKHASYIVAGVFGMEDAILASLRRLKAIDEAMVSEDAPHFQHEPSGMMEVGGMPSEILDYVRYRDYLALKLHTQQSAEAARVAREKIEHMQKLATPRQFTEEMNAVYSKRITDLESRLREVEARTVERCAKEADPIPIPIDDYLRIQNHVVKREVDLERNLRTGIAARIRALPSSTDTEEK